jgi:hypothetical protein
VLPANSSKFTPNPTAEHAAGQPKTATNGPPTTGAAGTADPGWYSNGTIRFRHSDGDCCYTPNDVKFQIDGKGVCTLRPGATYSHDVPAGQHQIVAKEGGADGFIGGLFGMNKIGTVTTNVPSGGEVAFSVYWSGGDCCGGGNHTAHLRQEY